MSGLSNNDKTSWDLTLVLLLSLALALVLYTVDSVLLQTALGLPFLLFAPGYVLTAAVFPKRDALDGLERTALSFGLSIAIVPLICFGLNYTPLGIRLQPILWSIVAFNVVLCLAAQWRRTRTADPYVPGWPGPSGAGPRGPKRAGSGVDKMIAVIVALSIVSSVAAVAYVVAVPREGEAFSELFILGPDGSIGSLPSNLNANGAGRLTIGIANHENRPVNYSVEVWLVNMTLVNGQTQVNVLRYMDTITVTLEPTSAPPEDKWTAQWETNYSFSVPFPGTYELCFVLLKDTPGFVGVRYTDYTGSAVEQRFLDNLNNSAVLTTDLHLVIT